MDSVSWSCRPLLDRSTSKKLLFRIQAKEALWYLQNPRRFNPLYGREEALRSFRTLKRQDFNRRDSSPLTISLCRSVAPPMSIPFTNTIGKVGQPVHIFNALRLRHPEK
jgi:hypothetical protein